MKLFGYYIIPEKVLHEFDNELKLTRKKLRQERNSLQNLQQRYNELEVSQDEAQPRNSRRSSNDDFTETSKYRNV